MRTVVWAGGRLRGHDEPVVAAADHGVTVGDGVFETLEVVGGAPFALTRHVHRLRRSASLIGLTIDEDAVRAAVAGVLAEHPGATRLRITATSGPGPMSSARGDGPGLVIATANDGAAATTCRAIRSPWPRNERSPLAGVKSTSYAENVVMMEHARARGGDEALLANLAGHLCEGTSTNVFIERDGEVLTPPLEAGCLAGITRALALEWAADAGLPVREAAQGELPFEVLDDVLAGTAFAAVTSSIRRVQPLASLDGVDLEAGPVLTRLAAVFDERAAAHTDPVPARSSAGA